jgi:HIRAN domain
VAELVQHEDGVSMRYLNDGVLAEAMEAGFVGYPGLPIGSTDLDGLAMEVLMRRLPPQDRADFGQMLERFGLPSGREYPDLTLLAYTGARMTSDSFGVTETFDGFERPFTYIFDVAGYRHNLPDDVALASGEALTFECEPNNEFDPNAIRIARRDGTTVGYVNRLQADIVSQWIDRDRIQASVFRINGRVQYPRLFVRAEVSAVVDSEAA